MSSSDPTFALDDAPSPSDMKPQEDAYIGREKPAPKRKPWKLYAGGCCLLMVVVVVLILVLVFTLKNDDTEASDTSRATAPVASPVATSPVASPVAAPVASPVVAPVDTEGTPNACTETHSAYQTCLAALPLEPSCLTCMNRVLQTANRASCLEFAGDICNERCLVECGNCLESIEDHVDCVVGDSCLLDCESDLPGIGEGIPPSNLVPLSVPGLVEDECKSENQVYQSCLDTLSPSDAASCAMCTHNALETAATPAVFCNALDDCTACETCEDRIVDFIGCTRVEGGELSCGGSTAPPRCVLPERNYQTCLNTLPPVQAQSCVDCINTHLDAASDATTCAGFLTTYCAGHNLCDIDCGTCLEDMETWVDCEISGNACPVECDPDECTVEKVVYLTCFRTLSAADEAQCVACTNAAIQNNTEASGFCQDFGLCSGCGVCADEIEDWVDCESPDFTTCSS